ncbi:MAG: hypothetical protein JO128_13335 [Alphaproteobacteria bacterium]|nr:hypothetical protein [Alphaproteobacteria bacterium]
MSTLLDIVLYGSFGLWAFAALGRLQAAWEVSQRRTGELRYALAAVGRRLLRDVETIQKLKDEVERVKESVAADLREQKERHATLAASTPPPSPEIHVTSEYPPSRRDAAWIVEFMRDSPLPRQPWEREPATSLLWAPSQSAALDRARQLTRECRTYIVAGVRPLA